MGGERSVLIRMTVMIRGRKNILNRVLVNILAFFERKYLKYLRIFAKLLKNMEVFLAICKIRKYFAVLSKIFFRPMIITRVTSDH